MNKIKYIIITLVLTITTGCLNYIELNDIGIINTIGIDKKEEKYIIDINMLTPTINNSEENTTYEVIASTLEEAFDKLYLLTSKNINLSHLELILLSKNLNSNDYDNITKFFLNRDDSRNTFPIIIVENYKSENIFKHTADEINSLIETNSKDDGIVSKKTFDELSEDIININISYVPTIKIDENIEILGYRSIYSENKLLSMRESISYNFLTNRISKCNLVDENLNIKIDQSITTMSINKNKIKITINSTLNNYTDRSDITDFYNKTLKTYLEEFIENNDLEYLRDLIKKYNYNYYKNHKDENIKFKVIVESKLNKEVS